MEGVGRPRAHSWKLGAVFPRQTGRPCGAWCLLTGSGGGGTQSLPAPLPPCSLGVLEASLIASLSAVSFSCAKTFLIFELE